MTSTGWVYHELYMWHDTGRATTVSSERRWLQAWEHYENPETKRRFRNLVEVAGLFEDLVALRPRMATVDEILRFHTPAYVQSIRAMSEASGGNAGEATPFGAGSFEIALLAAGGTITAVDAVLDGRVRNAYALVRPPGHHAEADVGRGFCIFGNVVVAIEHARATRGVGRVATVDWDVHHGNGTQKAFYRDPDVLTISIHQDRWYPRDSGAIDERGEGHGLGFNINIPLPPGSGHGAYLAAVERVVIPALHAFRPELIVVPSGFDGGRPGSPSARRRCPCDDPKRLAGGPGENSPDGAPGQGGSALVVFDRAIRRKMRDNEPDTMSARSSAATGSTLFSCKVRILRRATRREQETSHE